MNAIVKTSDMESAVAVIDSAPDDLNQLPVIQVRALEVLMRGGGISTAARAAGVSREAVYHWLEPGHRFGKILTQWKQAIVDASRTRLLMLCEHATNTIAEAVKSGDVDAAMKLLTRLGVLQSPPVGAPISQARAQRELAQASINSAKASDKERMTRNLAAMEDAMAAVEEVALPWPEVGQPELG